MRRDRSRLWGGGCLGAVPTVASALLGCDPPPFYTGPAFFANATREPVDVRLSEQVARADCERIAGRAGATLGHSAFAPEALYRVGPGEVLPLGPLAEGDNQHFCAAAIQILGMPDVSVAWSPERALAESEAQANFEDEEFARHSIRLEGTESLHRFAWGDGLEVSELPRQEIADEEPPRAFGWSAIPAASRVAVTGRGVLAGGCLSVGYEAAFSAGAFYLCVPDWAFPFDAGDSVGVTLSSIERPGYGAGRNLGGPARQLVVTDASGATPRSLEIWLGAFPGQAGSATFAPIEEPGYRARCGAFVEPVGIQLSSSSGTALLRPGELDDRTTANGRVRTLLGRAENVIVAPPGCEPERKDVGARFDLLEVTTEVQP